MPLIHRLDDFIRLRQQYPWFAYESFEYEIAGDALHMQFYFNLSDVYHFAPKASLTLKPAFFSGRAGIQGLDNLVFQIGMIELISYWKASCSPRVVIQPYMLDSEQTQWWKDLYFNGLGEFFYLNGLNPDPDGFMEIISQGSKMAPAIGFTPEKGYIVPVGGGKDSVVTLELLKETGLPIRPLIMNPRGATLDSCFAGGYGREAIIGIDRIIDPLLPEMNQKGFLNGHTPFSALLAFYTLLAAVLSGSKRIALSNESSANESTVPGSGVNHQYSKSYRFEKKFREYTAKYIHPGLEYFSFLRPLNELQIASLFARYHRYHKVFRSCNAGSKENIWCGQCPKCLFAWIMLEPFMGQAELTGIFGKDLLSEPRLGLTLQELAGKTETKPFECVGTIEEVNAALEMILKKRAPAIPVIFDNTGIHYTGEHQTKSYDLLREFNPEHYLSHDEEQILRKALRL
jgi:hypothetical protein